jgi:hypothetical protein
LAASQRPILKPIEKTMMQPSSLLFYQRPVALDRDRHAALKLSPGADLAFTAGASVVPLLSAEFTAAAREFAIVFMRGAEQELMPVVLTGTPGGQNVYVDDTGRWNASYLPAYVRRYPFAFAQTASDQYTVCIDEACPGFGEGTGASLFDAGGDPSPMLKQVVTNLGEYQRQAQLTQGFVRRLDAAGLLMEAAGKADLMDGRSLALQGFWIVNETRLRSLPDATLKDLFVSGEVGLIYAHLLSLGNLLELLRRQPPAVAVAAALSSEPLATPSTPSLVTH